MGVADIANRSCAERLAVHDELPFGFLPEGSFTVEVWQDGPNAARQEKRRGGRARHLVKQVGEASAHRGP